jgi:hypothetical protein
LWNIALIDGGISIGRTWITVARWVGWRWGIRVVVIVIRVSVGTAKKITHGIEHATHHIPRIDGNLSVAVVSVVSL